MNHPIRRRDRQVTEEEAVKLLAEGEYGFLGTADTNNVPYVTPLSYVVNDRKIYFHCAREGHKLVNIHENPKVCFCVVGKTKVLPAQFSTIYESAVAFGKAFVVEDEEERTFAFIEILKKYSPEFMEEGMDYIRRAGNKTFIVKIDIESMTGKARRE